MEELDGRGSGLLDDPVCPLRDVRNVGLENRLLTVLGFGISIRFIAEV
jgi:hypothetical protein